MTEHLMTECLMTECLMTECLMTEHLMTGLVNRGEREVLLLKKKSTHCH